MSSWGGMLGGLAQSIGGSAMGGKLIDALGPNVVGSVLDQLNQSGMGAKVNSWLGQGDNHPITPDELRQALGNQQLQEMAGKLGIPVNQVTEVLAQHLPAAVDQASPNGTLEPKAAG